MIEFAKGFAIWDLMPGHYVLTAAGGLVVDLAGVPLTFANKLDSLDGIAKSMNGRQRFIAARTPELAAELASLLDT
jgi:myo-inositol-1(or 4)-monophosphatase